MRTLELDDDGFWTVWEDGDHIGMFATEAEARAFMSDLDFLEIIDR